MGAPQEYVGYVILGGAMTTFWMNVLWAMGAHLYWERDSGNLELYIMSPAPMMAILAGMALGGMTTTPSGPRPSSPPACSSSTCPSTRRAGGCCAAVFALTLLALYGLGMMFASLFLLWGREAWHIGQPAAGAGLPADRHELPAQDACSRRALAAAALLIPLATGMDAMRQVLFRAEAFMPVRCRDRHPRRPGDRVPGRRQAVP